MDDAQAAIALKHLQWAAQETGLENELKDAEINLGYIGEVDWPALFTLPICIEREKEREKERVRAFCLLVLIMWLHLDRKMKTRRNCLWSKCMRNAL